MTVPVLAGCLGSAEPAGSFSFEEALAGCRPDPNATDPYPQDRIFAVRNAKVVGETLYLAGCLVNGRDTHFKPDCGSPHGPVRYSVRRVSDGEEVLTWPQGATLDSCADRKTRANTEWNLSDEPGRARIEVAWDLRKDICPADPREDGEGCPERSPDEGERVDGGEHRVEIEYIYGQNRTWETRVRIPWDWPLIG